MRAALSRLSAGAAAADVAADLPADSTAYMRLELAGRNSARGLQCVESVLLEIQRVSRPALAYKQARQDHREVVEVEWHRMV